MIKVSDELQSAINVIKQQAKDEGMTLDEVCGYTDYELFDYITGRGNNPALDENLIAVAEEIRELHRQHKLENNWLFLLTHEKRF